jgi:hypothetical protein
LATVVRPGGLRALHATQRRGLHPARGGRETHPVRDVSHGIAVRVNLDLVKRIGRERSFDSLIVRDVATTRQQRSSSAWVMPRLIPLEAPVTMATGCWVVFIVVFWF